MAYQWFLKIDGINGDSEDADHPNWIDIEAWSFGDTTPAETGGGGSAGKARFSDFYFIMKTNPATVRLARAGDDGDAIASAILSCVNKSMPDFKGPTGIKGEILRITMDDLHVASFQSRGSGSGDATPLNGVALNYSRIERKYSYDIEPAGVPKEYKTLMQMTIQMSKSSTPTK
jgi:type VI secretion system secreted protein Hcp